MKAEPDSSEPSGADDVLNIPELIPELFGGLMTFFRPGHREGVVPSRIKELARLKVAEINGCDT